MKKLGRYEIIEEVGRGAMGRIYRARDPQIDRVVAIKTISLGEFESVTETEFRQRFLREARAAGRLLHPGIVTIFDVGEDPDSGTPFIVMEYIEGRSLQDVGNTKQLKRDQALELIKQLADALDYAHREGIVHRDIKPSNIIVTSQGRAKIADFGVAKLQSIEMTQTGVMMGTPSYMSPEQMVGDPVDGRSDLFSLVTVLYWLLTGERPFAGTTMATLSFKIVYSEPLPPSSLVPSLGDGVDDVIHRGLAKEPERRYQTGQELADDLDDLLHGRPPRSRAQQPAEKPKTAPPPAPAAAPWRRQGVLVLIAFTALLLAVGGLSWQRWQSPPTAEPAPIDEAAPADTAATESEAPTQPAEPRLESPSPAPRRGARSAGAREPQPQPAQNRQETAAEASPQPVTSATVQLRGQHGFAAATLSLYADGNLLKEISLVSPGGLASFSEEATLMPGDRVLSITVREEGGERTERGYIAGNFARGEARTLRISFDPRGNTPGRGKMNLNWVE